MAEGEVRSAMPDLLFVVMVLIGLGVLWFINGGPGRVDSLRPFLEPPPPLGSGKTYGQGNGWTSFLQNVGDTSISVPAGDASPARGNVRITNTYGATGTTPAEEYVALRAEGASAVTITGWRLKSVLTSNTATIGQGALLPYSGRVNTEETIILNPGDEIIIATGRSPIGTSFRTNVCTGYFGQFQQFTPSLQQRCPLPTEELSRAGTTNLSDACIRYIENIPMCQMVVSPPFDLPESCQTFITEKFSYNACVTMHKNEPGFAGTEWRLYLGQNAELWRNEREIIQLLDQNGKVVDTASY